MTLSQFARFDFKDQNTNAYLRFKQHHTELNDLYWSFVPSYYYSLHHTKKLNQNEKTEIAFNLKGKDARRPPNTLSEWKDKLKEFSNWTRLGMLLSAASYLEIYIKDLVELSLRSDPLLLYGLSQTMDGAKLLKMEKCLSVEDQVVKCCKGEWKTRIAQLERLFGKLPPSIHSYATELDKIRILRNSVGHAFGRDLNEIKNLSGSSIIAPKRLAEITLKERLEVIANFAKEIDDLLGSKHIGTYEYILIYHNHRKKLQKKAFGRKEERVALSVLLNSYGTRASRSFCGNLIEHYNKC